jgi:hypothetical protein
MRSEERYDELLRKLQVIVTSTQEASQHHERLDAQMSAFQQSHQMILDSFEKLSISPRLDRSETNFSATTTITGTESIEADSVNMTIDYTLMRHHPGLGLRADRSSQPTVARSLLDEVEGWLDPGDPSRPLLYIKASKDDDGVHDLCNRIALEIAITGEMLLCYNGLPRDGAPPAPGWYTMTHLIWWLAAQLLIPVPHEDGHMPLDGYVAEIEPITQQLEKQTDRTAYILLYLPTESCHNEADRNLYYLLINQLVGLSRAGRTRLLLFSDGTDDAVLTHFLPNMVVINHQGHAEVALAEWETKMVGEI